MKIKIIFYHYKLQILVASQIIVEFQFALFVKGLWELLLFRHTEYPLWALTFSFRETFCSYMVLLQLADPIYTAVNNDEFAFGIFLDLSKAVKTVIVRFLSKSQGTMDSMEKLWNSYSVMWMTENNM